MMRVLFFVGLVVYLLEGTICDLSPDDLIVAFDHSNKFLILVLLEKRR